MPKSSAAITPSMKIPAPASPSPEGQFPRACCTPADDNSWRSCFKRHTNEADQKLANLTTKINKGFAGQQKTQTVMVSLPKSKKPLQRRPLAPLNSTSAPSPKSRMVAASKPKPAPMMARALKMMNNRYRR
uniref:Uncharacterized protein n=1 Tax=Panagrellus redivivus TaxID=6233 RepID=A0A7E4V0B9_PANRE